MLIWPRYTINLFFTKKTTQNPRVSDILGSKLNQNARQLI